MSSISGFNEFTKISAPLLNVLNRIFQFSSLDTIKNCRMVCQTWNSVVEPILRKRVKIVFNPNNSLGPLSFCDIYKYSEYLPFTSFTITRKYPKGMVSEYNEFFAVYGMNIKSLEFKMALLQLEEDSETETDSDSEHYIWHSREEPLDITPWIQNTPHLTSLKIIGRNIRNKIEVSLDKLSSVKFLHLEFCRFLLNFENKDLQKISADEIILGNVFFKKNGKFPDEVRLNDYFDFRNVSILYLETKHMLFRGLQQVLKLDMSVQVIKMKNFHAGIQLDNWKEAKGSVDYLCLNNGQFSESNALEISELCCLDSDVDFTVLPRSLKKLELSGIKRVDHSENRLVNLPNLMYFRFDTLANRISLEHVRFFKECQNLVEVELSYCIDSIINLSWLPKNLKKLIVDADLEFIGNEVDILEVDTLILYNHLHRLLRSQILSKIKPRILVATGYDKLDTTDIIRFVVENTQLEKIVVGFNQFDPQYDMHRNTPFETSLLSYFVDKKKANYYEFEKAYYGKAISAEVFNEWRNTDELDTLFQHFRVY